jgi:RNA polymerase sigma factor (sigma-70 family)
MDTISDDEIISGIRIKDRKVFEYVYRSYYYSVRNWLIKRLSNNENEVKDVFHDTLMSVYQSIIMSDFVLTSSFKTYLFSVIKNMMLVKFRNKTKENLIIGSTYDMDEQFSQNIGNTDEFLMEDFLISEMKMGLFHRKFKELPNDCKEILKRFFDEIALKNIAETLGYKSTNYVKKRKHLCKEFLKKKIEEDKYYKIIKEHENI